MEVIAVKIVLDSNALPAILTTTSMETETKQMLKIEEITRTFLIEVAKASAVSGTEEIKSFVAKLIAAGQYTEATEDEIEELDTILECLGA